MSSGSLEQWDEAGFVRLAGWIVVDAPLDVLCPRLERVVRVSVVLGGDDGLMFGSLLCEKGLALLMLHVEGIGESVGRATFCEGLDIFLLRLDGVEVDDGRGGGLLDLGAAWSAEWCLVRCDAECNCVVKRGGGCLAWSDGGWTHGGWCSHHGC